MKKICTHMTRERLARALDLDPRLIQEFDYYGLLPEPVDRADDGEPLFHSSALLVAHFVFRAMEAGFGVREIRSLLTTHELIGTTESCYGDLALVRVLAMREQLRQKLREGPARTAFDQQCDLDIYVLAAVEGAQPEAAPSPVAEVH